MEKSSHKENEHEDQEKYSSDEMRDVRTLLSWKAPSRPFRKKGREYFFSALLITMLAEIILFLFSQYEFMMAIAAVLFLAFALAITTPKDFRFKISTEGVSIEDHYYIWDELYDFYFKKVDGIDVLFVRTHDFIPGELKIPLTDISKDHLRKVMLQYLPYREIVRPTFMEKSADWLSRNFPLEKSR